MKVRGFVSTLIVAFAVMTMFEGWAASKKVISTEDFNKIFYGTWINTEYLGVPPRLQKRVRYLEKEWEAYTEITSARPIGLLDAQIDEMWVDRQGVVWYKAHWENTLLRGETAYQIGKISKSGDILEILISFSDDPKEEWEPDNIRYT